MNALTAAIVGIPIAGVIVYAAYRRPTTRITPAQAKRYDEVSETDDSFLRGDFQADTRSDFQRSVDAGYVESPEAFMARINAERAARGHGNDGFTRGTRRATQRMINTRGNE